VIFAGLALADAFVSPLAGTAGDRLGRRPVAFFGAAMTCVSGVLLVVLPDLAGAVVALAVLAVGICIAFAAAIPWLDETFGETDRGLAYGGLNLIYALGYTIGPLLGGWMLSHSGADAAYVFIAAISAVLGLTLARAWILQGARTG
jgi:MFS family permease